MNDTLQKQMQFLIEADKMKTIFRQTLVMDKSRQENDAEHSWHFALTALTLAEHADSKAIDVNHVLRMALVHDMVEIYAGDTFAYDAVGNTGKEDREREAAIRLFGMLPVEQGTAFRALWEEFEAMATPDALYASAIDRILPLIANMHTDGHTWVKHGVSKAQVYQRMAPIKAAIPALWAYVVEMIDQAIALGWVSEE